MVPVFAFCYVPLAGWILAFMDYIPGVPLFDNTLVGWKNFRLIAEDSSNILRVMKNTVIFALLGYLAAPIPMIFAIALNEVRSGRLKRAIQTITTFPNFISWVIVYALAFQFFSYDGLVSNGLMDMGITGKPTSLIAEADAVERAGLERGHLSGGYRRNRPGAVRSGFHRRCGEDTENLAHNIACGHAYFSGSDDDADQLLCGKRL